MAAADAVIPGPPRAVAVGSLNPTKLGAVRAVLLRCHPAARVFGLAVDPGVGEQPRSLAQTRRGALRRAEAALGQGGADWGLGLEGGVAFRATGAWLCGVVAVATRDGRRSHGYSAMLRLPEAVAARVREGQELGPVMDALIGEAHTKTRQGAIGILTAGLVERQAGWEVTTACALAPLLRPDLYGQA